MRLPINFEAQLADWEKEYGLLLGLSVTGCVSVSFSPWRWTACAPW